MKALLDYAFISIIGFVAGVWLMVGAVYFGLAGAAFRQVTPVPQGSAYFHNADDLVFAEVDSTPDGLEKRSSTDVAQDRFRRTVRWLFQSNDLAKELEALEEANCSEKAMRRYAQLLSEVNTSGFDLKTGRMFRRDGGRMGKAQWLEMFEGMAPLLPLAYMKDDLVPDNFRHVLKAVPRKTGWKTCEFDPAPLRSLERLDFGEL